MEILLEPGEHILDIDEEIDLTKTILAFTYRDSTEPILKNATAESIIVKPIYCPDAVGFDCARWDGIPPVTIYVSRMTRFEINGSLIFENVILSG